MFQSRKKRILGDVQRARRRRTLATAAIVAVLTVSAVVALIFLTPRTSTQNGLIGTPISAAVYNQLTGVSDSTLVAVGSGQGVTRLTPESGPLLTSGGKPEVLYIGAEYCPFCAAERWSMIVALSKFGSFNGLTYMLSADSPEVFPDTSTFSFRTVTYSSQYISFVSVEEQDRNHAPLQSPTSQEQSLINLYDPQGSIPFVDVATFNVTFNGGSQFSPGILTGLNWTQIGSQLDNPSTIIAKAVDGAANNLITGICKADGSMPSSLCGLTLTPLTMAPPKINSITDRHDRRNHHQRHIQGGHIMEKLSTPYLVIAAVGIGLAIYVTNEYLTQNFNSCNINQFFSCGGVYQSGYTSLFGIPFYLMGLVWFPIVFAIGLVTTAMGKRLVNSEILLPLLMIGNVFTAYLWYLELAVIHIICPLCVSLYAVNYALTAIVLVAIVEEPGISDAALEGSVTDGADGPRPALELRTLRVSIALILSLLIFIFFVPLVPYWTQATCSSQFCRAIPIGGYYTGFDSLGLLFFHWGASLGTSFGVTTYVPPVVMITLGGTLTQLTAFGFSLFILFPIALFIVTLMTPEEWRAIRSGLSRLQRFRNK